ncbi:Protease 1 precursor [compost metagenome]
MKILNYLIIVFLFASNFAKSQVGDNGYPFLYEKLSSERRAGREEYVNASRDILPLSQLKGNIKTFEIEGFNNQTIINEVSQLNDEEYANQNIYGKSFQKEINITDDNNRIQYDGRYYYIYKITSSDAKALQVYFKKYLLTKDSKLFFYADNGFILGEFNDKNNPDSQTKGVEFGIQPIPGNTFYIELSYPVTSTDKPSLITEKVIHSFTEFYGGAYGTAGNCHKNVACEFTGTNDKSRNIKSVGLMLYPIYQSGTNTHTYSASCSGNLMNNTAQNGEPYFLTAAHCIGSQAANNNVNWNKELITLFNYEALTCTSNGSNAPSTLSNNSVLGCTILTQNPFNANDYALLKLESTANALAQYKVCYAGWDNNPNSYSVNQTNSYGIHHPKGDAKKISYVSDVYPVMGYDSTVLSGLFGYYSMGLSQNTQGNFLQNSWRSGIVEKGSSGSPLFNSFDKLIGSLSVGPDPSKFNCDAPNINNSTGPKFYTYYSRFSNNYYTMSAWLNPNGTNVQSIGPYCPNNSLQIGSPPIITITYPPTNPPVGNSWEEEPIDINGERIHPANTWGKKMYLNQNFPQQIDSKFYFYQSVVPKNANTFALSENLYELLNNVDTSPSNLSDLKLWGIYKIIECNKLKYIKPAQITMKNPGSTGQPNVTYLIDIVGVTNDRVHIIIHESRNSSPNFKTFELQSYKIINNELVFESYLTLFYNQPNISIGNYYDFDNNHLMLRTNDTMVYSCFFNEQNGAWSMNNTPISYTNMQPRIKLTGNKLFINPGGLNKLDIYNLATNSPAVTLQASISNIFLGNPNNIQIFENSANQYNIIYRRHVNYYDYGYEMMQLNLSNNSSSHATMPIDFKNVPYNGGQKIDFIMKNNEIIKLGKMPWSQSATSEYPNYSYRNFKTDANGNWVNDKVNYFKWSEIGGFNNQYFISNDLIYGSNAKRRVFSVREVDYLAHPYTMFNNMTIYSSAYHRPKKLDNSDFYYGITNGKQYFTNLKLSVGTFLFRALNNGYDYNTRTNDVKTVILDNKTTPLTGNKNVNIYSKYSIVMKPGFSVSSSSGVEFNAIPQQTFPSDLPSCSLTFEDMLNPQLTELPSELLYLKQGNVQNKPHLGEIVLIEAQNASATNLGSEISIYPNPTKGVVYINFNGKSKDYSNLIVYSPDGRKTLSQKISNNNTEVNLTQYPAGVYLITLLGVDGKSYPYKVIKR